MNLWHFGEIGKNLTNLLQMFDVFSGKKVLITGHTGFKGSWLTAWLKDLNANIVGISLDPSTKPSHFVSANLGDGIIDCRFDIRNKCIVEEVILDTKPDFVFHLAAQALVRQSYENPVDTWEINVLGTLNVLEALRKLENSCAAVIITSDKCYENVEWVWGYKETDALGGSDPYSASKGAAELVIRSYVRSFFPKSNSKIRIASARAGNVIGGGDWSEDRIVPDCVRAWSNDKIVELRNPFATRPWQHVLDPLSGYLLLAAELKQRDIFHGEAFNFGPAAFANHSVIDLVRQMSLHWDKVRWLEISDKNKGPRECGLLKLNCDKSMHYLNWQPSLNFEKTVKITSEWYHKFYSAPEAISDFTLHQIHEYIKSANLNGLAWTQ